jgi:hypothetical protein
MGSRIHRRLAYERWRIGLQLSASSVAGGRHTRSGMQNSESTVKAIYGEPVAAPGKTSGVVGIRTLSHGANRNAEWCEQTPGGMLKRCAP